MTRRLARLACLLTIAVMWVTAFWGAAFYYASVGVGNGMAWVDAFEEAWPWLYLAGAGLAVLTGILFALNRIMR